MTMNSKPKVTQHDPDLLSVVSIEHQGCGDYIIKYEADDDSDPVCCPGCGEEASK